MLRLHCVLKPTKQAVLDEAAARGDGFTRDDTKDAEIDEAYRLKYGNGGTQ